MRLTKPKLIKYIAIAIVAVAIASIWSERSKQKTIEIPLRDYPDIKNSGKIRAVTEYNTLNYFLSNDSISGFSYELLNAFARDKDLKAEITPEMSFEKRFADLNNGTFDIIAYFIPVTSQWKDSLLLATPITRSKQILVQRKPEYDSACVYITSQIDLALKTIYVEKGSPSILRIRNLANEIADTIYVEEIEKYGPEQLIAMVAHKDIDYAVADEKIAKALIDSFPQLDINTDISFSQFYSWGVRKQSPVLLDSLNSWLDTYLKTNEYRQLHLKYFGSFPW